MIQIFRLSKSFGTNIALDDIGLTVRKGEFVFITGPSGAGKTTLLRLIFGADQPTNGQILINGINLTRIRRQKLDLLRRKIGFVFQDFKLLNNKTVFQNVALALEVTGERQVIIRKRTYRDSVILMKLSNDVAKLNGVIQAGIIMGTPTNKHF